MKEKIIHYFNQGATTYENAAELQINVAQNLASRLKNIPAKQILEIGCGTGLFSQHLLSQFPQASLLLTDIAPSMVQICNARFSNYSQVATACMDSETLSYPKEFDLIASSMTLHWVGNIKACINNLTNHLAPGGVLMFSMLGENSLYEWREMCEQFHVPAATLLFPAHQWLKNAFPMLQIEIEMIKQPYASAHDFLNSLKSLGARAPYSGHVPASAGKLRKLLRHYSNPIEMTYEVIYGYYKK